MHIDAGKIGIVKIMADNKKTDNVDLEGENIHWDVDMSYSQYLNLDQVLSAQKPQSGEHDEMLFVIIHHVMELWMKQAMHELSAARSLIDQNNLAPSLKMFSRIDHILKQMTGVWDVLTTMTPVDYLKFRDGLGKSSGFQSYQFRILEFTLGNKIKELVKVHENNPVAFAAVNDALNSPTLYDTVLGLLKKRGFDIDDEVINRDVTEKYQANDSVKQAWITIYSDTEQYWDLYDLSEKLMDFEHNFQIWRYNHLKAVERIIGAKMGTGGSSGLPYLAKGLDAKLFPELLAVRTEL